MIMKHIPEVYIIGVFNNTY